MTGASSGIGLAFAHRFASAGHPLVLVARQPARLEAIAAELSARYSVRCVPIALDLSRPDAAEALWQRCCAAGLDIEILVNNAGTSVRNDQQLDAPEQVEAMFQLNVVTLAGLCMRFGGAMAKRGHGKILNIGSMTAYVGASSMIGYGPSKQLVIAYTRELHDVLAPMGVRVSCLIPGLTDTAFFASSGVPFDLAAARRLGMMQPDAVATLGYDLAFAGPRELICGMKNRIIARLAPVIPRAVIDRSRRKLHGGPPSLMLPTSGA